MTGKGKLSLDASCGNPANVTNRERFSTAEWSDVNAMYRILGDSMPSLKGHSGIRLKMSRRVDLTCFDGKSARRGMASCHITVISPSDTA